MTQAACGWHDNQAHNQARIRAAASAADEANLFTSKSILSPKMATNISTCQYRLYLCRILLQIWCVISDIRHTLPKNG